MFNFILPFIFFLPSFYTYGQQLDINPLIGYSGPDAIILVIGSEPRGINKEIREYTIERRQKGEQSFKKLTTILPLKDYGDFENNIAKIRTRFKHLQPLSGVNSRDLVQYVMDGNSLLNTGITGDKFLVRAGFGLVWWDDNVKANTEYQYRVTGTVTSRESEWISLSSSSLKANIESIKATYNSINNRMLLNLYCTHCSMVENIEVKRTHYKDDALIIQPLIAITNHIDTTYFTLVDTTARAHRIYRYQIRVVDIAGNVSEWSDPYTTVAFDYLQMPLPYDIHTRFDTAGNNVSIKWKQDYPELLTYLNLYRSTTSSDGFELIATLPTGQTEYADYDVSGVNSYFYYFETAYKMYATPKQGHRFSAVYTAQDKPHPPIITYTDAQPEGIRIEWECTDPNASGFVVFRSSDKNNFSQISTIIDTDLGKGKYSFTDTDMNLRGDREYFYAVKSKSEAHIYSEWSEIYAIKPVANIPRPPAPIDADIRVDNGRIILYWNTSFDEQDVNILGYQVIKHYISSTITTLKSDTFFTFNNSWIDSLVQSGIQYQYQIITVSVHGGYSYPTAVMSVTIQTELPPAPDGISLNKQDNGILISWELPAGGEHLRYQIFRYTRGNDPVILGTTLPGVNKWTDIKSNDGELYFYFIRSISSDGTQSVESDESSVRY